MVQHRTRLLRSPPSTSPAPTPTLFTVSPYPLMGDIWLPSKSVKIFYEGIHNNDTLENSYSQRIRILTHPNPPNLTDPIVAFTLARYPSHPIHCHPPHPPGELVQGGTLCPLSPHRFIRYLG